MDKVPAAHAFLDLSDYARPLALWLARRLRHSPVMPIHLTLSFTVVGLAAAVLFALGRWPAVAGVLLLLKSALDAADGSLARVRHRPSRVGRFLDSVCDFVVMAAVFGGIAYGAWSHTGQAGVWALALAALMCATLQGSAYNYYYVRYRAQTSGDQTSHVREDAPEGYTWDDPTVLHGLHFLYRLIYGWQDALMQWLDWRVAHADAPLKPAYLTATTVLGLGTQLLVIALCAIVGQPGWAPWFFVTVFNLYWLILILIRWLESHSAHANHDSQAV